MKITFKDNQCIVDREDGDKKYYGRLNAAGESALLYDIKKTLNAEGFDLIKKRMWKDGHLMDNMQQYLRTRKPTGDPEKDIAIWNNWWSVNGADEYFNHGQVTLRVVYDIFNP